jgi:Asp/Glu/hydantoin racemase
MRIHVINPNTTASMTAKIGVAAKAAVSPGVEVRAVNPDFGPPSIEGYFDEAFSVLRASNVPVLALEEPGSNARRMIEAEIERALAEDGAEAIVLGCAGMTDLARDLERRVGVPVLDGVACAVGLTEALVRVGLRTSKRNTFAPPLAKAFVGEFAKFSPR